MLSITDRGTNDPTRRELLRVGGLSLFGLTVPRLLVAYSSLVQFCCISLARPASSLREICADKLRRLNG